MDKQEVIKFFCELGSKVGREVCHSTLEHDCFCSDGPALGTFQTFNPEIAAYIYNAVCEKMERDKHSQKGED